MTQLATRSRKHPIQERYISAKAVLDAINQSVSEEIARLGIPEDEIEAQVDATMRAEARLGYAEALDDYRAARDAIIAWGLAELAPHLPADARRMLESVHDGRHPQFRERLADILARWNPGR